jgi:hypothetical protein
MGFQDYPELTGKVALGKRIEQQLFEDLSRTSIPNGIQLATQV